MLVIPGHSIVRPPEDAWIELDLGAGTGHEQFCQCCGRYKVHRWQMRNGNGNGKRKIQTRYAAMYQHPLRPRQWLFIEGLPCWHRTLNAAWKAIERYARRDHTYLEITRAKPRRPLPVRLP